MTHATAPLSLPHHLKLVSVGEMQAIEQAADAAGHSYAEMMELAGKAVAATLLQHYGALRPTTTVLVGPGNNGGDGLVCARYLHQAGLPVRVYLWKRATDPAQDYEQHLAKVVALGVPVVHADEDATFDRLRQWLAESTVLVDALLGTGANRPIGGQLADLLQSIQSTRSQRPHLDVVAVDCASGLNCDTGAVDPNTVPATLTVTFAYAKYGHYQFPGVEVTGHLEVVDIGVYPYSGAELRTFLLQPEVVRSWLPPRPRVSHKGSFGKVMAVVGSARYPGAAYLSCAAAGRVGAGLVTGAVAKPVWSIMAGRLAEPTWLPLPEGEASEEGAIDQRAAPVVREALPGYDALLLGCGLGQAPTTGRFVFDLLTGAQLSPTVIDADGLNLLAQRPGWPSLLPQQTILTPHAAELGRLCQLPLETVLRERWSLARQQAVEWQAVVLAKGPYTVIADPAGWLAVLPVATPALATAGTGDVLAGAIAGLLAQGVAPFAAASLGAWLQGAAGLACEREIGPAGVVAGDLLLRLPVVMNNLRRL
jgi:ADP-dependent NAD(P)H-hydrate dehydratase / NAD(P)H-hydrate epimerase